MSENETLGLGFGAVDTSKAAEEGAQMEVTNPGTGEVFRWEDGRPWTITLFGMDSERVTRVVQQQQDRRVSIQMRTRQPASAEVMMKDSIEVLVAATKTWDIPMSDGKTPAPADSKNYRDAYTKFRWLNEQVDAFVGNRANFLKKKQNA